MIRAAMARELDLRSHRSSAVTLEKVQAGLIIVMSPQQRAILHEMFGVERKRILVLGDLDLNTLSRVIPDPFGGPNAAYEECVEQIDRCIGELVRILEKEAQAAPSQAPSS